MDSSGIIIGGLISFISVTGAIVLQYYLNLGKQKAEARQHAMRVLYEKQIEFYDELLKILPEVNEYITSIDVWLGESSPQAQEKVKEFAGKTGKVWPLKELMDKYYVYLPTKVLEESTELLSECMSLSHKPSMEKTERAIKLLFSLMNFMRKCIGVDAVSKDLFEAFANPKKASKQPDIS